ncbi:MAG TPA: polyprenyl synthetase family protein [Blastocatellia bacterium]|nr:polyprenyl synthetase family protein [Blastocatellia bacterium]
MSDRLTNFIARRQPMIETALERSLPLSAQHGAERLNEALRAAVFPGGKRWRPVLTLLGTMTAGGSAQTALPIACAIEFLHTSSLILDDLPAMDDAHLRRGRAALHLVYGEGLAMLAALALLNQAYALLAQDGTGRLIVEAARCVGPDGMIGGQAADLDIRASRGNSHALASRQLKTTALARLTIIAGAIAAGADERDVSALARYGECLGAAYQICDDLLDEFGESATTGKNVGQDARHLRSNFTAQFGAEEARRLAHDLLAESKQALRERFGECQTASLLIEAADLVIGGAGPLRTLTNVAS